ncbi:ATP-dependent dethiobiotin synthetase BioD [Agrobacterium sp. FDAARGOS_525]|uniref:dethiobiotin synthase n=1 Tax=Agrobacterium sp. FDAARGOS_525 TaxID=2420311 RepID=UPI000F670A8F|nr:dethiobiotin synthase [Agrobacterium sp. FDAARGOS_525]RSC31117.1 ATP-dependent dethiobiotin synthetase BioD [Agrobacterium sp. FDAARGOS_525]
MSLRFVISGTDTGIGKTVFAAALTHALKAHYWKPVQSGLEEETDSETVARLAGVPHTHILPEAYRLKTPASPHLSARLDNSTIDPAFLQPPRLDGPLVIEGAGGLLVPLTESVLFVDIFARWQIPLILCARTALGTINHTLLSLEALRQRAIPVQGVVFIGEEDKENQRVISNIGAVRPLGRLPRLADLTSDALHQAFAQHFNLADFLEAPE